MSEPFNAESIEQRVINLERALSTALLNAGRLARVVDEQSGRIESLEGANVKRDSDPEPDVEPPYRMTRPTNCDALVIDCGKVWRPVFGPDGMWEAANDDDWVAWEAFTDPQPFQNCTLTANDPEPPIESVVLDCEGDPWKRSSLEHEWCGVEGDDELPWRDLCYQLPPVTLLYRGEA